MLVLLFNYTLFVRLTGLEPAHRKTLDPKSSASTNFATDATIVMVKIKYLYTIFIFSVAKVIKFFDFLQAKRLKNLQF